MEQILKTRNFSFVGEPIYSTANLKIDNTPTNHIIVIDCSYSMSGELSKIRKQLKNKLPNLVKEHDSVSIIWFSGKNEYGVLKEEVYVKSLKDLSDLNNAIDRFLQPVGLTGFLGPLKLTEDLIKRIKNGGKYSLLFITDGYDNQHTKGDILNQVANLSKYVNSATFVEYGYYCNRKLLTEMAETIGGVNLFSENFDDYEPIFDSFITNTAFSSKRVSFKPSCKVLLDFVFGYDNNNNIITYKLDDNGMVSIPEDTARLLYLTDSDLNNRFDIKDKKDVYSLLYTLSVRMKSDYIYEVLNSLGDKYVIDLYTNAFGKFNLTNFQKTCLDIYNGSVVQFKEGYVSDYVPNPNAYCVMDLLSDLSEHEDNKLYPYHSEFNYMRIGALKKQRSTNLSATEVEDIKTLTENLKASNDVDKLLEKITEIKDSKFELEFTPHDETIGYSLSDFVYNSSRPNVSFRIKIDGQVDLSPIKDTPMLYIDTHIYRTYTIIKDGIINIKKIPVSLSATTYLNIRQNTDLLNGTEYDSKQIYILDLTKLPIINRNMATTNLAKEFVEKNYALLKLQARQKVFKYYYNQKFEKVSVGLLDKFGEKTTKFLEQYGITDNGFQPKYDTVKSGDSYISTELNVKLAGLSALPSVNDIIKKINSGKGLTLREQIMYEPFKEYNNFIDSDVYADSKDQDTLLKVWLDNMKNSAIKRTRQLNNELAKSLFSVVLSQNWFSDLGSIENNSLTIDVDGNQLSAQILLEDKTVEI